MKNQLAACAVFFLFLGTINATGQGQGSGRNPGTEDPELSRGPVLLSGKVVLDDGAPLSKSALVQTICKGQKRIAAHTDSQGRFTFKIGEQHSVSEAMGGGFEDASISAKGGMSVGDTPNLAHNLREWRACGVLAELQGFTSEVVELMARTGDEGGDIGSITLHRIGRVEGLIISATTAAAPAQASEALEKGYSQENINKWDAAEKSFQKAVHIYPQYAVAWFELGRLLLLKKDVAGAKHSFETSIAADANYLSPYIGLARIESQEQAWQPLADLTAHAISLNPGGSPEIWFFNGVANYNLQKLVVAEKSAREGLRLDTEHRFSKLEYLLGILLEERRDYSDAKEHMQAYLHLVTSPHDKEAAQRELAEIARVSATSTALTGGTKN
jgi:tetratricopeptide (TPR) repeat protein